MKKPVAALLMSLLLAACGPGGSPSRDPNNYNVLVIVLDAMRADKLGCYGFEREATPTIDAFSRDPDAVLFENHYAQAPFTKTSTASLFTGLFPFQHGVLAGHNRKTDDSWKEATTPILDSSHRTMAERLRERDFYTFGVVKSRHLVGDYGFAQGFRDYFSPEEIGRDSERLEKTVELMKEAPARFFGYVHFSACHHPFKEGERDRSYMERYGFAYDEEGRKAAGADFTTPDIKHEILEGRVTLDPEDVRFLNLVYEACTRDVDRELFGALIDEMKKDGIYDSTMIVVTADHGEELYDHRGYAHSYHVWNEILRVPLIVKFPRGLRPAALPDRVGSLSSTIDLLPSILAFGGDENLEDLPGVSLFQGESQGFVLSEQMSSKKRRWTLVRRGHKLIFSQDSLGEGIKSSDGEELLFNLARDPAETSDQAKEQEVLVRQMTAFAHAIFDSAPGLRTRAPIIETDLDPQALEELRQLGYIK